jgi:hypothetical protein
MVRPVSPPGQGPLGVVGRIIGLFAVTGLGLGVGALLFLWATGALTPEESQGIGEAFGAAFASAIAITGVLAFALLIGVVLAAIGGMHAAAAIPTRSPAAVAAAISGAVGHVVMILVLGATLIMGMGILSAAGETEESPAEAVESQEDVELCEELFGPGSPECQPQEEEAEGSGATLDAKLIAQLGLGLIPAGLVGALTAAIMFRSRRDTEGGSSEVKD